MSLVSFDQGRTGHSRRKPTSLLTNLHHLEDLDGLRGGGSADPVEGGLQERMKAPRSWARWSNGLVKAIGLALNLRFGGRAHIGLAKMDVEEWKRHIKQEHVPYRRDCRDCVEAMGFSSPHRRSRNASSAFVMAVDIMGPFEQGRDLGLNQRCKYVMVATIPAPIVKDLDGAPEEPLDHEAEVKDVVEIEEEKEDVELATEEQVAELSRAGESPGRGSSSEPHDCRANAISSGGGHRAGTLQGSRPLQDVGGAAMSAALGQGEVFLTKAVARWVQAREMVHAMTSGDDSQSNGRVEAELLQLKRRMRLLLLWRVQHALYGLRSSPADWATYRNRLMRSFQWQQEGMTLELRETQEPNLWKIVERRPLDQDEPPPKGFIGVYVDDFIVVGAKDIVKGALSRIEMEWKCSPAEWVSSERWTKFSGFELRWSSVDEDSGLYVGQQAYIQELLSRHPSVTPATVPFPGVPNDEPEAEVTLEDVRKAQGVVGELLWVSVRSRPDLAYGVAWMGRQVTRTPKRVLEYGGQMLGYLKTTLAWPLHYGRARSSIPGEHYNPTMRVDVLSDASFGPPSGRGCQGVIGTDGGEPVQWESRQLAFCTLSSAEAELLGYTEAMTMGDSLAALVNVLEGSGDEKGTECRLGGDNQAGLRILEAPDGPWRTRRLRLRAHALRERVKWGAWKVIHIPGQHLIADFLTKPIGVAARWQHFFAAMGMKPVVEASSDSLGSKVARIAALVGGLAGVLTWRPSGPTGKAAQSLAVAAMVASLATSWKAGCDSKKRATGPTRNEYVDPPCLMDFKIR